MNSTTDRMRGSGDGIVIATDRDCPGVVARPPRLYMGFLAIGAALQYLWPLRVLPDGMSTGARYALASALIALGIAVMAVAMRQFRQAGTNVETPKPTTTLVTDGLYRLSRNPMYVSLTLLYTGIGLAANSLWILALSVPLLLLMRYGVIAREERYLERKFGRRYLAYKAAVRRWV